MTLFNCLWLSRPTQTFKIMSMAKLLSVQQSFLKCISLGLRSPIPCTSLSGESNSINLALYWRYWAFASCWSHCHKNSCLSFSQSFILADQASSQDPWAAAKPWTVVSNPWTPPIHHRCHHHHYTTTIPHICQFWYTTTLFRPVQSTPKSV